MRYPKGHKQEVRSRIVEAAARALRKEGLDGVSIPALMEEVGLTHGGFYGHFSSRDELVAEAIRLAGSETASRVFADDSGGIEALLAVYLSKGHVQRPERGCVLAALGTEAVRQSAPVQRAFAHTSQGFLKHIDRKLHPKASREKISDDALAIAIRMIGAIVLARLVDDGPLADRILSVARNA
jgi:TetR/AcrR family transcriptional repressor of nem operon